jgi:hypothetical protein
MQQPTTEGPWRCVGFFYAASGQHHYRVLWHVSLETLLRHAAKQQADEISVFQSFDGSACAFVI